MRGLRYSIGLLLATVWIAPLRAQEPSGSIRGHVTDLRRRKQPLQGAVVRVGQPDYRDPGGRRLPPHGDSGWNGHPRVTMIGYAPVARPGHGGGGRDTRRRRAPGGSGGQPGRAGGGRLRGAAPGQHHRCRDQGDLEGVQHRPRRQPHGADPEQGRRRPGRREQRAGREDLDPDSRRHLDQRQQRAALRRRRAAPRWRRRRCHRRPRPAQLPESRRHREHDGAARRRPPRPSTVPTRPTASS